MIHRSAIALLVLALGLAALFVGQRLLPSLDDWGEPLVHETFTDEGWRSRWAVRSGRLEIRKGSLITSGDSEAKILLRRPVGGRVAVEYTGTVLPGTRACDLSVGWYEHVEFAADGSVAKAGGEYRLQVGSFDNSFSCIIDPAGRMVAYSGFRLAVGKTYRVRAEFDDDAMSMLVDGQEVLSYQPAFPIADGHVGIMGYYPGKAFADIRVWQRPARDATGALGAAEALAREQRFAEAGPAYRDAAKQVSPAAR